MKTGNCFSRVRLAPHVLLLSSWRMHVWKCVIQRTQPIWVRQLDTKKNTGDKIQTEHRPPAGGVCVLCTCLKWPSLTHMVANTFAI